MPPPLPSPTDAAQAPIGYTSKFRLELPRQPPPPDAAVGIGGGIKPPSDFPSPGRSHNVTDPGFSEDTEALSTKIRESTREAVRAAVRRNWRATLMGSSWHEAFILNIILTTSNDDVIGKTVKQLAHIIAPGAAKHLVPYFSTVDFDSTATQILDRCSDKFLDNALERRLKTISARELINALAKAERLGYEHGDILDENLERIIGGIPGAPPALPSQPLPQPPQTQYMQQPQQPLQLRCSDCGGIFHDRGSYDHHVSNRMCKAQPADGYGAKYWCPNCGSAFKTKGGLSYHEANKVCGPPRPKPATQPAGPPPATPVFNHYNHTGYNQPTAPHVPPPANSQGTQRIINTPPRASSDDPYAHLNPVTRAKMNEELIQAEMTYAPRIKEAEAIQNPSERKAKLANISNSFSTRQSMIRKKYGVRLRVRRTRAEIEAQQSRMGIAHSGPPSEADDTPAAKRLRTETPGSGSGSHAPRVAIADMSTGLTGTTAATPATADPTSRFTSVNSPQPPPPAEPSNSLSSLQRKGYRVSSHIGQPSSPDRVMSDLGSKSHPVSLRESASASSESEDSDGDEEIPASLPTGGAAAK